VAGEGKIGLPLGEWGICGEEENGEFASVLNASGEEVDEGEKVGNGWTGPSLRREAARWGSRASRSIAAN